jgi:hypothetical protein
MCAKNVISPTFLAVIVASQENLPIRIRKLLLILHVLPVTGRGQAANTNDSIVHEIGRRTMLTSQVLQVHFEYCCVISTIDWDRTSSRGQHEPMTLAWSRFMDPKCSPPLLNGIGVVT